MKNNDPRHPQKDVGLTPNIPKLTLKMFETSIVLTKDDAKAIKYVAKYYMQLWMFIPDALR